MLEPGALGQLTRPLKVSCVCAFYMDTKSLFSNEDIGKYDRFRTPFRPLLAPALASSSDEL